MDRKVLAFGSPLLDMLAAVSDGFLESIPGGKGGMVMVDAAWQRDVAGRLEKPPRMAPGGSAGNTLFALARLGVPAAMLGKLGCDPEGDFYRSRLRELGGSDEYFITCGEDTGRCLVMVTPDTERTMRTNLGAALTLTAEEAESKARDLAGFDLVYIEGYTVVNRGAFKAVLEGAARSGAKVALDLSSYEIARDFRDCLKDTLAGYIDIVFANEDEARAFLGGELSREELLRGLGAYCPVACLKLGSEGSMILADGEIHRVAADKVEAVDTTGAGDLWQAGFLYGWLAGRPWAECGRIASRLGAEVVKIVGADIPEERWNELINELKQP